MSHQDRVEQRQLADVWAKYPPTWKQEAKAPRKVRAKNFMEGLGVGWFVGQIIRTIKD